MGAMTEFLSSSRAESQRLGFRIFRSAGVKASELVAFFAECAEKRPDVIIMRTGADELYQVLPQLSSACHTIVADSLLEFRKTLHSGNVADFLNSGAEIYEAGLEDEFRVAELVRRCYSNYKNHYHANPCLDQERILEGLVEFSLGFIAHAQRTLFVAAIKDRLVGYLCMEIRDGVGSTVIGGAALDIPMALRHKVLCDLTHRGDLWLIERNVRRFAAVTRTDKIYIQKLLYHNMHTLPSQTLVTLHLNLFLAQAGEQGAQQPVEWPPVIPSESNAVNLTRYELKSPVGLRHERSVIFEQADRIFRYSLEMDAVGICAFSSLYSQRKSVAKEVVGGEVTAG